MLKNLASFGATAAVRSSFTFEIRPQSSHLILNPYPCRTVHQLNSLPEASNAHANISNRQHCMGPSVGRYEPETQVRKFRFTGKCPRLTISKNISNPNLSHIEHIEVNQGRPLSCPRQPTPPLKCTLAGNSEKQHCDSEERNTSNSKTLHGSYVDILPMFSLNPPSKTKEGKSPSGTSKKVERGRYGAQVSATSGKETNTIFRTLTRSEEGRNSPNVSRSYNFKRKTSVFEKKSEKNTEDRSKTIDIPDNNDRLSKLEHDLRVVDNNGYSKQVSIESDNGDMIAKGAGSIEHNSNSRNNNATSASARSTSPKSIKEKSSQPNQSNNIASHTETDSISDDKTLLNKHSQSPVAKYNLNISSDAIKTEGTASKKLAPSQEQNKPSRLFSRSIKSKSTSFQNHKSSPNVRASEKKTRPEIGGESASIPSGNGKSLKSNAPFSSRGTSDGVGKKKFHSTALNAQKQVTNFNAHNSSKRDSSVLDRFRNRNKSLNKIDFTSLPRYDFEFKNHLNPKKSLSNQKSEESLNASITEIAASNIDKYGVFSVRSDIFEKSKKIQGTYKLRTETTFKYAIPTKLMPFTKSNAVLQRPRSSSQGRILYSKTPFKGLEIKKDNKPSSQEPIAERGGSVGSVELAVPADRNCQDTGGPPVMKVPLTIRKSGALEHRVHLNPSRHRHDFSAKYENVYKM